MKGHGGFEGATSVARRASRALLALSFAAGAATLLLLAPWNGARADVSLSRDFGSAEMRLLPLDRASEPAVARLRVPGLHGDLKAAFIAAGPAAEAPASAALDQMSDLEAQLQAAWTSQDWPLAIQTIEAILALDPGRTEMLDNLYAAHVNYGYRLYAEGQLPQARAEFESALDIKPDGQEAQAGIGLVQQADLSATVVPTATHTPITPSAPTATHTPITPGVPTATPSPSPSPTATPSPSPSPTGTPSAPPTQYVVRTGDTLYSLAQQFGTTVQAIMQANGLRSYIIWIGQELTIPSGGALPPGPLMHIVLPGDTLYSLARHYGTTVQAIMWANGLWSYMIYVGQPLYIPTVSPSGGGVHLVQWGETLYSIARLYNTTVDAIKTANGLTSDLILAGTQLMIP